MSIIINCTLNDSFEMCNNVAVAARTLAQEQAVFGLSKVFYSNTSTVDLI